MAGSLRSAFDNYLRLQKLADVCGAADADRRRAEEAWRTLQESLAAMVRSVEREPA